MKKIALSALSAATLMTIASGAHANASGITTGAFSLNGPTAYTYNTTVVPEFRAGANVASYSGWGTAVHLSVWGLAPNKTYTAHGHVNACGKDSAAAGGHWQKSPSDEETGPNELWFMFTTDGIGTGNRTSTRPVGLWCHPTQIDRHSRRWRRPGRLHHRAVLETHQPPATNVPIRSRGLDCGTPDRTSTRGFEVPPVGLEPTLGGFNLPALPLTCGFTPLGGEWKGRSADLRVNRGKSCPGFLWSSGGLTTEAGNRLRIRRRFCRSPTQGRQGFDPDSARSADQCPGRVSKKSGSA